MAPCRPAPPATSRPAVISTETQWSGEISLQIGAGRITVGDLSAQSINGALILFSSYRFRAPLEMTCEAARPGPRSSAEDVACSLFLATSYMLLVTSFIEGGRK